MVSLAGRILQTSVHVLVPQTTVAVSFRSAFFNLQWACMAAMAVAVALAAR